MNALCCVQNLVWRISKPLIRYIKTDEEIKMVLFLTAFTAMREEVRTWY
jgi:hypothetical protein